jgi:SHS2 domain-containing protein
MTASFETFEHGADIGIRGRGKTLSEAFENGAKSMYSLVVVNLDTVIPEKPVKISCESFDLECLFVAWLNSLLAESDIQRLIFSDFKVKIQNLRLTGTAMGEPFDFSRHQRGVEVKGATFTELSVRQEGDLWIAQCVVDV